MYSGDLHSALKTSVIGEAEVSGINYKLIRNQNGKEDFVDVLHACPNQFSTSGLQSTDFLNFLGFIRSHCAFHIRGEAYCRSLMPNKNVAEIANAVSAAFQKFHQASKELEGCGIFIDRPEGFGFFWGNQSSGRSFSPHQPYGNGHIGSKVEKMKESEDLFFKYVLTWVEGQSGRGWTTHYRAKHMPLTPEFQSALDFLGGFSSYRECPEFEFESCWWRYFPFPEGDDFQRGFNGAATYAHQYFDSHAQHFSKGLQSLLEAHSIIEPQGFSFLNIKPQVTQSQPIKESKPVSKSMKTELETPKNGYKYDIAISFAGTERTQAEELANLVKDAGFQVFYDAFYPEQLWGKDLASHFDRIYRKESRYCVMFVSKEYSERMWTTHERRSAQARFIQEKGNEYILPIKMDDTDLDGLPPTVGHLSIQEHSIDQISKILLKKLKA